MLRDVYKLGYFLIYKEINDQANKFEEAIWRIRLLVTIFATLH